MNIYTLILNTVDGIDKDVSLVKKIEDFETESTFSVGDKIFDYNCHEFKVIKVCHHLGLEYDTNGCSHHIEVYCVADTLTQADAEKFDDWNY